MVDNFGGSKNINLQPSEIDVPLKMRVTISSASTVNDGFIPFGSTLSSFTVSAHHGEANTSSTDIIASSSSVANTIVVYLQHTTAYISGIYHVTALGTFSLTGSTKQLIKQLDFNRVYMKDR